MPRALPGKVLGLERAGSGIGKRCPASAFAILHSAFALALHGAGGEATDNVLL